MAPQLNINELYTIQKKKSQLRTVSFDRVIELIHKRIKNVSSYGGLNTFYEIPGLLVGFPLYNLLECTDYVLKALRKNGFLVQLLPPPHISVVYISWDPKDINPPKAPTQPKAIDSGKVKKQLLRLF